jgi:thiosulfate dehydrogenase [quinone] large subunit
MSTQRRTLAADLFGRETDFEYSEQWIGYALVSLRLVIAWVFLQAGLDKLFQGDWTAAGYLDFAIPADNPMRETFVDMAGMSFVDPLVIWGQILIGLALLLGVAVRFAAFWGAVQMVLFWLSHLEGGIMAGLPIEHGWVVSSHVVYVLLLFGLGAVGAGRIAGLDEYLEALPVVRNNRWLRYLLG